MVYVLFIVACIMSAHPAQPWCGNVPQGTVLAFYDEASCTAAGGDMLARVARRGEVLSARVVCLPVAMPGRSS